MAQTYGVLHSFTVPPSAPQVGLVLGTDGNTYGTTSGGGGKSAGTVFKMTTAGALTVLHTFAGDDGANPQGSLVQATDGFFYGTTTAGGTSDNGIVYKIDSTGNFTLLHKFTGPDGANPYGSLVQATDGNFYGTTSSGGANTLGTVFKMTPAGVVTTLRSFNGTDGDYPYAGLVQASDGKLYGTTSAGGSGIVGTVFRIDPSGSPFATLYNFSGSDGSNPKARLIQASDGKLYGTTYGGGSNGDGTVFQITTAGGFATIHNFNSSDGNASSAPLAQGPDGKLYGTTEVGGLNDLGTVFRIDPTGTPFATLYSFAGSDGKLPISGVLPDNSGNLYGTTQAGGTLGGGTAFRLVISSGVLTTLHTFGGLGTGHEPSSPVVQGADGALYGTTYRGGAGNFGTVYKIDAAGTFTLLHEFAGQPGDGANPQAGLVLASDGNFYGATVNGGSGDIGTVFRMTPAGAVTILHSFADTDGGGPSGSLVQATDGKLYGMTQWGGTNNLGVLYRVDTSGTGNFLAIHSFASNEAANPAGYLIQAPDGNLYGLSWSGGAAANGNAFRTTTAGVVTPLHDFAETDGQFPFGGLVRASDGNFYGTTRLGGVNHEGTLFRMTSAGTVTTIYSFAGPDGSGPIDGLILAADGKLYGATYSGGTYGKGTVFSSTLGGSLTTLHSLTGPDGNGAAARLLQIPSGRLYGTANQGGDGAAGVVYQVSLCTPPVVTASNNGPICAGATLQLSASTVAGATYAWTGPNGFISSLQNPAIPSATASAAGTYSVTATVAGCASAPATTTAVVKSPPSAAISAAASVCPGSSGNGASVPDAGPGATYSWSITNGTLTSGSGTRSVVFTAGTSGSVSLSVTVTSNGCAASGSVSVGLRCGGSFYRLPPCRLVDTRNPNGPLGGPKIQPAGTSDRQFILTGACGVPANALAVSANVTATNETDAGLLSIYPGNASRTGTNTVVFPLSKARACNGILTLSNDGRGAVNVQNTAAGTVDLIIDVNGYFQ